MVTTSQPAPGVLNIQVEGRLDAMVVGEFEDLADHILKTKPTGVVFDLEKATFLDSSGLSAIVKLYKSLNKLRTKIVFCRVPPPVMNLFKLTRLDIVFPLFENLEEGLAFVTPKKR
jgi:anti-sigma B factor antagonist